jgi:hypothetical protein
LTRITACLSSLGALALAFAACGGDKSGIGFDDPNDAGGLAADGAPLGDGNGGPLLGGDGATSNFKITLAPSNATLFVDTAKTPVVGATQAYQGILHAASGTTDVTGEMTLSIADPVGSFQGATFTSVTKLPNGALGMTTKIHAAARGESGEANLTLVALRASGDQRDFYFVVPYEDAPTPARDVLKFATKLTQVDVAILQDTTGSMGGSIDNLKTNLSKAGGIIDGLKAAIPDVGIAIVDHRDYPYASYGGPGDFPVKVWQTITTNTAAAQTAVNNYTVGDGNDEPEAQIPSMFHLLTGQALTWPTGSVPAHTPAPGTEGGVDFRPGSFRVVVEITDASWHNYDVGDDPANPDPYSFAAPTYAQLKTAFGTAHAKYVGVVDEDGASANSHQESNNLSDATQSNVAPAAFGGTCGAGQCCTGMGGVAQAPSGPGGTCRLNFTIQNGNGLDSSIVKAIQALSVGASFDVTAIPSNDPANAGGVDATKFIKQLRAMSEGDATAGCPAHATRKSSPSLGYDDVFVAVVTGTPVCFEVIPQMNTTVPPKDVAQFFNAFIDVVGLPGNTKLDKRSVLFLVPPKDVGVK